MNKTSIRDQFVEFYGNGSDGSAPRPDQWERILHRPPDQPITLVNFFKFREVADYGKELNDAPGTVAFDRYALVSVPTMERVGGKFLLIAPFQAALIGADEDWDLIAIGAYPNQRAFLDLYQDAGYRDAFVHRRAACLQQKVLIAAA